MIVVPPTDSPVPGWQLQVTYRLEDGSFSISFLGSSSIAPDLIAGRLANYDGIWWRFSTLDDNGRDVPAWESLRDELLRVACSTARHGGNELQTRARVRNHPFWRQFVQDVQDLWIVAEVMLS